MSLEGMYPWLCQQQLDLVENTLHGWIHSKTQENKTTTKRKKYDVLKEPIYMNIDLKGDTKTEWPRKNLLKTVK